MQRCAHLRLHKAAPPQGLHLVRAAVSVAALVPTRVGEEAGNTERAGELAWAAAVMGHPYARKAATPSDRSFMLHTGCATCVFGTCLDKKTAQFR